MRKLVLVLGIIFVLCLSSVSANWFTDFSGNFYDNSFGKIFGERVQMSPNDCYDSDGGRDEFVAGTVELTNGFYIKDRCARVDKAVKERYCNSNGGVVSEIIYCKDNCVENACVFSDTNNLNNVPKDSSSSSSSSGSGIPVEKINETQTIDGQIDRTNVVTQTQTKGFWARLKSFFGGGAKSDSKDLAVVDCENCNYYSKGNKRCPNGAEEICDRALNHGEFCSDGDNYGTNWYLTGGTCAPTCTNARGCDNPGDTPCYNTLSEGICVENSDDGCLDVEHLFDCGLSETCDPIIGSCVCDTTKGGDCGCDDECNEGEKQCMGSSGASRGYEICGKWDGGGCLKLGGSIPGGNGNGFEMCTANERCFDNGDCRNINSCSGKEKRCIDTRRPGPLRYRLEQCDGESFNQIGICSNGCNPSKTDCR